MNDLIRPALYESFHRIWPVDVPPGLPAPPADYEAAIEGTEPWDVVGPVCESGDFLAKDRRPAPARTGALLATFSAGAYGMVMASNYNTRPRAAEILVDGSEAIVARRRETLEDLVEQERAALDSGRPRSVEMMLRVDPNGRTPSLAFEARWSSHAEPILESPASSAALASPWSAASPFPSVGFRSWPRSPARRRRFQSRGPRRRRWRPGRSPTTSSDRPARGRPPPTSRSSSTISPTTPPCSTSAIPTAWDRSSGCPTPPRPAPTPNHWPTAWPRPLRTVDRPTPPGSRSSSPGSRSRGRNNPTPSRLREAGPYAVPPLLRELTVCRARSVNVRTFLLAENLGPARLARPSPR